MNIRVFLADDHRMFRETLRIPLEANTDIQVVGEASSGQEVLAQLGTVQPDILVLDINLPDMSGIEVANRVGRSFPEIRVVALSGYTERIFVEEMLKAGALAYVVKTAGSEELIFALRAVSKGHRFLSPEITHCMLPAGEDSQLPSPALLGKREQEVLCLLASGLRSQEIGNQLGISPATVDVHRRNIKQKLGLNSVAELTRYAIRKGLLSA